MSVRSLCLAATVAIAATGAANAAEFQVQSDQLDHEAILTPGTGALSISQGVGGDNRVGSRTSSTLASSILPFALPAIPAGDTISAATLTVVFEGESASLKIEAGDGNIDLYGLPFDPSPFTQESSRYFSGPNDGTAGVTKLQDEFFTPAEYPAETTTSTKVSMDISAYLTSLYTAGAVAGDFAVLRLSYDIAALSGNNRYRLVTSAGDGSTIDSQPHTIEEGAPFLSITTIPEPTSLAVLGLGAMGLVARRRR